MCRAGSESEFVQEKVRLVSKGKDDQYEVTVLSRRSFVCHLNLPPRMSHEGC